MRHNFLKNWYIAEASGIYNRTAGQQFIKNEELITYVDIKSFPELDKFETPEELEAAVEDIQSQLTAPIQWVNIASGNRAFALAHFTDEAGKDVYFGRFFRQIDRVMTGKWANTDMLGWRLNTGAGQKMQSGLDPQTLIKTENVFTSSQAVIQQVIQNGLTDKTMQDGLNAVASGQPLPILFIDQQPNEAAIRDYFGEILQPLALKANLVTGEADNARALIDNQPWDVCSIKWPMSMNHNLVDSYMISPDGVEVGISSKGGAGAKASAKNLHDAVLAVEKRKDNELLQTVAYARDVVEIIATNSANEGPLILGIKLGLMNQNDAEYVLKLIKAQVDRPRNLSDNLKVMWNNGRSVKGNRINKSHPNYTAGRHLLANIAQVVCNTINAEPQFGTQALKLMNQSSIVQIYTKTGHSGNDLKLVGFNSIYPPNFSGKIVLESDKNYNSTRTGGKISFSFK